LAIGPGGNRDPVRVISHRVRRIVVTGGLNDAAIAIGGHELRHALEVLEMSDATTESQVDALYTRIGWRTSGHTVETQAALAAGNGIAKELRTSRIPHK
jgi:hypothetical protein